MFPSHRRSSARSPIPLASVASGAISTASTDSDSSHEKPGVCARRLRMLAMTVVVALLTGIAGYVELAGPLATPAAAEGATGTAGVFVPASGRILDTRPASQVGPYLTAMPAGAWRSIQVNGQAGVPSSGVSAVVVNLTVVNQSGAGQLHADKDQTSTPNTAVTYMNYTAAGAQSNTATIAVADNGKIQLESNHATDLMVDVQGYYTSGSTPAPGGFVPVTPARLVNTRNGTGLDQNALAGGTTSTIQATNGAADVPAGASAVAVDITITNDTATSGHFFVPYAADAAKPNVSYQFAPGATRSYGTQVALSTTGTRPAHSRSHSRVADTPSTSSLTSSATSPPQTPRAPSRRLPPGSMTHEPAATPRSLPAQLRQSQSQASLASPLPAYRR